MRIAICPSCDSPKIRKMTGTVRRHVNGEECRVPTVTYWKCDACGEEVYPPASVRKMSAHLSLARETADAKS